MISKSQITAWISFSPFPPLSSPTAGGRCRRRNPSLPTRSPVGITANAGKSDLLLRLRGGVGVAWLSHETELRENYNRCLTGYRLHSVQNESVKVKARMRACSVKQSCRRGRRRRLLCGWGGQEVRWWVITVCCCRRPLFVGFLVCTRVSHGPFQFKVQTKCSCSACFIEDTLYASTCGSQVSHNPRTITELSFDISVV